MDTIPPPATRPERNSVLAASKTVLPGWEELPSERQRELVLSLAAMVVKRLTTIQHPQEMSDD